MVSLVVLILKMDMDLSHFALYMKLQTLKALQNSSVAG